MEEVGQHARRPLAPSAEVAPDWDLEPALADPEDLAQVHAVPHDPEPAADIGGLPADQAPRRTELRDRREPYPIPEVE
jgi:hypothetical protein